MKKGLGITVFNHDSEEEIKVKGGAAESFHRKFIYEHEATVEHMKGVIKSSEFCYQEVM